MGEAKPGPSEFEPWRDSILAEIASRSRAEVMARLSALNPSSEPKEKIDAEFWRRSSEDEQALSSEGWDVK